MKTLYQMLILFLLLLFLGCAGASVNLIDPSKKYEPTKNAILLFDTPIQKHVVIGIVKGVGSQYNNESQVIESMREKAQSVGADALVLVSTEKEHVLPSIHANPVSGSPPIHIAGGNKIIITGYAIRFINTK